MRKIGSVLVLLLGVAVVFSCFDSVGAVAQDFKLKPNFGEKKLETGFEPDPFKKAIISGGDKVVTVNGVKMRITEAPDFRLIYKAGDTFPLSFYVSSETDTTLLINLPNGKFISDDDSGGNLNPLITLEKPMSGQYDIWVGSFGAKGKNAKATLFITELKVKTPIPKDLK